MFKRMCVLVIIGTIFSATTVYAMSGVEFLKLTSASSESQVLEPIIIKFIQQGYMKVPDWPELNNEMEDLIREQGLANDRVEDIALEAAKNLGMVKK